MKISIIHRRQLTIIDKNGEEKPFTLNDMQKQFVKDATGKDIILKVDRWDLAH